MGLHYCKLIKNVLLIIVQENITDKFYQLLYDVKESRQVILYYSHNMCSIIMVETEATHLNVLKVYTIVDCRTLNKFYNYK